jgi:flavin-dependent dehydrogenase
LRRAGIEVLVIDRKRFPRDKTCAGWVTPQVWQAIGLDPEEYGRSTCSEVAGTARTIQPITGFRTGLIGGDSIESHYGRTVSYGIRRCEFDAFLLERSGVPSRLGETFRSLERSGMGWIVNGDISARLVVGAGGHFCPVARELGARSIPGSSVVAAQEIEFEASDADLDRGAARGEVPELYFCRDLKGYAWCFRKGKFLNIGLGRVDPEHVSEHVAEFCSFLKERGSVACDIPSRFHGHAYQLYERVEPKLTGDGILLIGDAAGLAYPQSGEGIRPAVESAILAADVIIAAEGHYDASRLDPYLRAVHQRFGPPRRRSAADWLPASWLRAAAARLLVNRSFARKVVIDRWFLHVQQPALRVQCPSEIPPLPTCETISHVSAR